MCLSVYPFVCLSVCLVVCLSLCLSVCLSVCLFCIACFLVSVIIQSCLTVLFPSLSIMQLNEAANKKFDRCENIRIDWGLEVDKEDEEKIYDEPPQDDTKVIP